MDEALYEEMFRVESGHWWFQAKHRIVSALLDRYVAGHVDPSANHRPQVADLGCGCGMLIYRLRDRYDVLGLDGSPQAASLAARRGLTIKVGQLPGPTPLSGDHFDAVLLLDVLEHLDDDAGTIQEAIRLLKSGGVLIASVPAHQWLWTGRDELHHHRRRYSKQQFLHLIDQTHLHLLALTYINSILFPIAVVERLLRKLRPTSGLGDLDIPPAPLNWLMRESFAVERHLIGRLPLPPGLSLLAVARKKILD